MSTRDFYLGWISIIFGIVMPFCVLFLIPLYADAIKETESILSGILYGTGILILTIIGLVIIGCLFAILPYILMAFLSGWVA